MRDLSIIATPPAQRHAIKTFVSQWNDDTLIEGAQRELKRGWSDLLFTQRSKDNPKNGC